MIMADVNKLEITKKKDVFKTKTWKKGIIEELLDNTNDNSYIHKFHHETSNWKPLPEKDNK